MKSERETEAPLTAEDVQAILSICSPRGLLVGGQALAFWADHLRVARPADLSSGVTADADFIGDSVLAEDLGKRLGWQIWIPALDDATPQTGARGVPHHFSPAQGDVAADRRRRHWKERIAATARVPDRSLEQMTGRGSRARTPARASPGVFPSVMVVEAP